MKPLFQKLITVMCILLLTVFSSCDFSAKGDLKRAEKMMNEADAVKADFWAEPEYRKAQKAFDEAVDLERERKINECRDKVTEAKGWAEEAIALSIKRQQEMEEERDKLGTYKN
ncbi:hypothetical protein H8D57_02420 [bacterium]|nr:hypothetical protein [bacterium]